MLTERLQPSRKEIQPAPSTWRNRGPSLQPFIAEKAYGTERRPLTPTQRSFSNPAERDGADWPSPRIRSAKDDDATSTASDAGTNLPPSDVAVLQQLTKILRSKTFIQSEKLSRFLRFVVEHVIHGNPECLKEYLVGVEVYDRKPPYDPSQDSIVRTEARRLRNKLKEYYGADGKDDPVYIYLRPGSYAPAFQSREELAGLADAAGPQHLLFSATSPVITAVFPFTDITGNAISAKYARGIPDELAYALASNACCTVISPFSIACLPAEGTEMASTMKKLGAQLAFEGSARVEQSTLRITARIVDAAGFQHWVERIDIEMETQTSFAIEESIAKALMLGLDVLRIPHAGLIKTTVS